MAKYVFARNGMGNYVTGTGMREDMLMQAFNMFLSRSGVLLTGDLLVTQNTVPDMSVNVAAGRCFVPNSSYTVNTVNSTKYYGVLSDTITNLAIATNTSGSTRIDLICVKIDSIVAPNDYASNVASILVVQGTPGAGQPATPSNHLLLAVITIPTGTTTQIVTGDIADNRVYVSLDTMGGAGLRTFATALEGASSNPSMGNGSLSMQYTEYGNLVFISAVVQFGSTSSFGIGSGALSLTLPFNAHASLSSYSFKGRLHYGAISPDQSMTAYVEPGTNDLLLCYLDTSSSYPQIRQITDTTPSTFNAVGTSDFMKIDGYYFRS